MTPNRKGTSFNVGQLTVKITADTSEITKAIKEMERQMTPTQINKTLGMIDELRIAQKETMTSKQIGSLSKGFICNKLEEEIDALKSEMVLLIEKY